jgi:CHAT domain-containing protein
MKNTFTNLKRNLNFSDSLRETKITMINDNSTSHPIFWAPFVLVGGTD